MWPQHLCVRTPWVVLRMELLKKLDVADNFTQLVVAVVVIAGCTLVARLFDDPKPQSVASPAAAESTVASTVSSGPMQICIEGLPNNPPRALAGALKTAMDLEATPVVVATGPRAVVRLATMNDFRKCSPQTARIMVSYLRPIYCTLSNPAILMSIPRYLAVLYVRHTPSDNRINSCAASAGRRGQDMLTKADARV